MGIIVQKFGGTSVSTPENRQKVLEKIISAKKEGKQVVVVVSAMGRKGEPYSTDNLIELVEDIKENISSREMDLLLSCGEIISGVLLTGLLQSRGYKAICLTGAQAGIITDNFHGCARIIKVNPELIHYYLNQDYIVVVAGYQGITEDGEITTLGRGGSDTTAAALGVALNAEIVEIYTDVNGLKTADPRIVEEAKTLDKVTYNEVCQLAYEGARVIHPRAVEIAMQGSIPLRIRSTFTDDPGTLVVNKVYPYEGKQIKGDRLITGIAQITNISQIKINSPEISKMEIKKEILETIANNNISIDFINIFPEQIVFTVPDTLAEKVEKIIASKGYQVSVLKNCAKVAAVGAGMTGVPGVMARIVKALTDEGIEILQSADSYTTIWCLVNNKDMKKAVKALLKEFDLAEE
ncbi:MAG: Aspartokinase [Clostridia bacterium 41_269]|nr:MAG: Aspartokinase [Clostridia bacterium 41_269]